MKTLLSRMKDAVSGGETVILVTVIASSGSTPRGAGARMLVDGSGRIAGTIGGGAVEGRCIQMAREMICSAAPCRQTFSLSQEDTAGLGMVCGGQVEVHFLPISGGDDKIIELCRQAGETFAAGEPLWLLTPLQDGQLTLATESSMPTDPQITQIAGQPWFTEQIHRPGKVYIFGGGHVAQALVPVLQPLDFPCVVLEDRPEFADRRLFPQAYDVKLVSFSDVGRYVSITEHDYVCIMTRGHDNDLLVESQVLRTPVRYIGVIGSRKKAQFTFGKLQDMGFSQQELARIVTPIGLPLGGRTPEEIAISIAAQLIQHRAGKQS